MDFLWVWWLRLRQLLLGWRLPLSLQRKRHLFQRITINRFLALFDNSNFLTDHLLLIRDNRLGFHHVRLRRTERLQRLRAFRECAQPCPKLRKRLRHVSEVDVAQVYLLRKRQPVEVVGHEPRAAAHDEIRQREVQPPRRVRDHRPEGKRARHRYHHARPRHLRERVHQGAPREHSDEGARVERPQIVHDLVVVQRADERGVDGVAALLLLGVPLVGLDEDVDGSGLRGYQQAEQVEAEEAVGSANELDDIVAAELDNDIRHKRHRRRQERQMRIIRGYAGPFN